MVCANTSRYHWICRAGQRCEQGSRERERTLVRGETSSSSHPTYCRTLPPRAKKAVKSGSYT
jgi:hypothetical protein